VPDNSAYGQNLPNLYGMAGAMKDKAGQDVRT